MRSRRLKGCALLVAMVLCGPALAREPAPSVGASLFDGIVRESDADLLFDYLRQSARAAFEGGEAPPADALVQRGEQMCEALKRRGGLAARVVIDALERSVRESVPDAPPPALPPSYPAQRI